MIKEKTVVAIIHSEMMLRMNGQLNRAHTVTVVVLSAGCNLLFFSLIHKYPKWVLIIRTNVPAHKRCDHFSFLSYHLRKLFEKKKQMIIQNVLFTFTTIFFFPSQIRDYMVLRSRTECFFHHNCQIPLRMKSSYVLLIYLSTKLSILLIKF